VHPRLRVRIASSVPVAYLSAKLCDVFPDGTSSLLTRGVLNVAHRSSSTAPEPFEPGASTEVMVELDATSWVFETGNRIRLSLSGADWPNLWPPPASGTLKIDRSSLELSLPIVDGEPPFPEPPQFTPSPGEDAHAAEPAGEQPQTVWRIERDVLGRESRAVISHGSDYEGELGAPVEERYEGTLGVSTEDPGLAWARGSARYRITCPEATVTTKARLDLRSDTDAYHVVVEVVAEEEGGGIGRHIRRFERTIPRRLQ
jgi:uncharacterized protein